MPVSFLNMNRRAFSNSQYPAEMFPESHSRFPGLLRYWVSSLNIPSPLMSANWLSCCATLSWGQTSFCVTSFIIIPINEWVSSLLLQDHCLLLLPKVTVTLSALLWIHVAGCICRFICTVQSTAAWCGGACLESQPLGWGKRITVRSTPA